MAELFRDPRIEYVNESSGNLSRFDQSHLVGICTESISPFQCASLLILQIFKSGGPRSLLILFMCSLWICYFYIYPLPFLYFLHAPQFTKALRFLQAVFFYNS